MQRRLLIVFTDGESSQVSPLLKLTLHRRVTPVFVHVWEPGERIFSHGRADRRYVSDPQSKQALDDLAEITGSTHSFEEGDFGAIARAARDAVGRAGTRTRIDSYARIALAPWFVLAGACRSRSSSGGGTSNTAASLAKCAALSHCSCCRCSRRRCSQAAAAAARARPARRLRSSIPRS